MFMWTYAAGLVDLCILSGRASAALREAACAPQPSGGCGARPTCLVRYLQRLHLARLEAETIESASRAVLARFDVAGTPPELNGAGRYRRRSAWSGALS